jgi:hypothetical protein
MAMFKQLYDDISSTLTYVLIDDVSRRAVIIDPVNHHLDDYIALSKQVMQVFCLTVLHSAFLHCLVKH